MNAPEKIVERSQFLGSSDMAAVLGLSPWSTPLDVYLQKRREAPPADADHEKAKLFRRGKRLEPIICQMLTEERGLDIVARNQRYVHAEHPFLACEIDAEAMVEGERVNVEAKSAHHFTAWKYGEEGSDQVPVEYACQAAFAQMVTRRNRTIFGVLFGADNLVTYELLRDLETEAAMLERAVAFWHDHVLAGVPPAPINLPDVLKLFRRAPSTEVEASEEIVPLVGELEEAKQAAAAAEERQLDLKFQIGRYMLGEAAIDLERKKNGAPKALIATGAKPGQHLLTYCGRELLLVNLQSQVRIDSDRVRKEYPEVAVACSKSLSFYKFERPRVKRR